MLSSRKVGAACADYEVAYCLFPKYLGEIVGTAQDAISANRTFTFGHIIVQETEDFGMS
jgi:hypothetical protein